MKRLLVPGVVLACLCVMEVWSQPVVGQGSMAGEVTQTSVILQSRPTRGDRMVDGDLPGCPGVARFQVAHWPNFRVSTYTDWMEAVPEHDFIVKTRVEGLRPNLRYYYRVEWHLTGSIPPTATPAPFARSPMPPPSGP